MEKVPYLDVFSKHFGICAYMRNKFLWNNPKLVDILNQHFKTEHVDDLSNKILTKNYYYFVLVRAKKKRLHCPRVGGAEW